MKKIILIMQYLNNKILIPSGDKYVKSLYPHFGIKVKKIE